MPDSRPATSNASLILCAGVFALADWLAGYAGNYAYFYITWDVRTHGWYNKAINRFEFSLFIEAAIAFCAGLIVLLGQSFARPNAVVSRSALPFAAATGVLFSVVRWGIWGISRATSFEIPLVAEIALAIALAAASSLAICRWRWGNRDHTRRGFPVITPSQTPPSPPNTSSPPGSPSSHPPGK